MGLLNRIEELEKELLELKELVKEEREFPQEGDEYWLINGDCSFQVFKWNYDSFDKRAYEIGNTYRTKEEAEFVVEKIRIEAELRNLSDSWDLEKTQCTFSFNWEVEEFEVEYLNYNQYHGSYYFDSVDSLKQALETVGEERIKKYLFGVEG